MVFSVDSSVLQISHDRKYRVLDPEIRSNCYLATCNYGGDISIDARDGGIAIAENFGRFEVFLMERWLAETVARVGLSHTWRI
jgi:hypothetical protein